MNLPARMIRTLPSLALRAGHIVGFFTLFIGLASPAFADLMLTIGPEKTTVVQPTTGNTTSITLTAYLGASGIGVVSESVASYAVPIDLSPPTGVGAPVGMTLTGATARTPFPNGTFGDSVTHGVPSGEGDLLVSVVGPPGFPPVVFGTTSLALFDFTISIDSTVALGDYSVDVVRGGVLLAFDPDLTDKVHFGNPAVIRVVAVPEPSTLSVLGLLAVPTVLRRRRRSI